MLEAKQSVGESPSVPFQFDSICSHLDDEPGASASNEQLLAVVNAVCEWLYPARSRRATMMLRAFVFVWYLKPSWLGDPTQAELARRLSISKARLGRITSEMRRKFGFYTAGMRHEDARAKFAAHAKQNAARLAAARREKASGRARTMPPPR